MTALGVISQAADDPFAAGFRQYLKGDYEACAQQATRAVAAQRPDENWAVLQLQSLMVVGRNQDAAHSLSNLLLRLPRSIRLRVIGHDVCQRAGMTDSARRLLLEVNTLASERPYLYRDVTNLAAIGRAALLLGADPRQVLEAVFDPARKARPPCREAFLHTGELALSKQDFAEAAKTYREGLEHFPDDPDLLAGLAQSFLSGDRKQMQPAAEAALKQNPRHVPTLLLLAEHAVDAEQYSAAEELLSRALSVNPGEPGALALRTAIRHLTQPNRLDDSDRTRALQDWPANPRFDFLLGRKLSEKYRFAEGAAAQRRALKLDMNYVPAKIQLAQDLLRLGQEEEGWGLAEEAHRSDGYSVVAYNLVNLRHALAAFTNLTDGGLTVKMMPKESELYGAEALNLLLTAKRKLEAKYGATLRDPVTVEIFARPSDFEVRTFGLPGNPGYLGVCFGPVITVNSPASQRGHPENWRAVLWHEFCHAVTLQMTQHRMPRWLSEGLSVFEERSADPRWGQRMNSQFRQLILDGEMKPVSELSSAFLSPKSAAHLQFAYFESSLVVEHIASRYGFDKLRDILNDLGSGAEINETIARHTTQMEALEREFAAFARQQAESYVPGLEWTKPASERLPAEVATQFGLEKNYHRLLERSRRLVEERKFAEAKTPLQKIMEAGRSQLLESEPYALLAQAHRALGEFEEEWAVLEAQAKLDGDAVDTYSRLMVLGRQLGRWDGVMRNARRYLEMNPMAAQPYDFMSEAAQALKQPDEAVWALKKLLVVGPADPAEVHYRLASLLADSDPPQAKRQVLLALEEAPRFRAAQALLLKLAEPGR